MLSAPHAYVFAHLLLPDLTETLVAAHCLDYSTLADQDGAAVQVVALTEDAGEFTVAAPGWSVPVTVTQTQTPAPGLTVRCGCPALRGRLCGHQAQVLLALLRRTELRIFFDTDLRQTRLRREARAYGLEGEVDPAAHFSVRYADQQLSLVPRQAGLLAFTPAAQQQLTEVLLPPRPTTPTAASAAATRRILVLGPHKYYGHLTVHLFDAPLTAAGKPKNPLTGVPPLDAALASPNLAESRFYAAVSRLQQPHGERNPPVDHAALRAVVENPLGLAVFWSPEALSDRTTAPGLRPLGLRPGPVEVSLEVTERAAFHEVVARVQLNGATYAPEALPLKFAAFLALDNVWYLVERPAVRRVLAFFKDRPGPLVLHHSQFAAFQHAILAPLAPDVPVTYVGLAPATPAQLTAHGVTQAPEKLLYLSDSGDYVDLVPVMRYGSVEVPVLARQPVYLTDARTRKPFALPRDETAEVAFTALLTRQHPDFAEQLHREAFSLSRRQFLEEEWFLEAFETWQQQGITVLGFRELKNNLYTPHKARVTVRVGTEANWFDTELHVRFGPQKVPLASLHKALRNKSRYVTLGDGTRGILPQHWLDRFARYFSAGELVGERLRTPKISFATVAADYEPEFLTPETRAQLAEYQAQLTDFAGIEPVAPPAELRGTLRPYQQHGLDWLCFLDQFGFGGCLADDMGLGKTITVLALLLLQRQRRPGAVSLVVVPTSLVFNWQAEAARFAPALRLLVVHGPDRPRSSGAFANHDVVLTTYGTLLTDVGFLKSYPFNYVILDESQAIKNPASQRYHAVRQLQARNRLVLTGTPIENNTYDLYGQLSFACPGLLGTQQHFKTQFATPIDKFKSTPHARALLARIRPFVLRRTKQQVAAELPAKTEMVVYCDMGEEQRQVYERFRKQYREWLMGKEPEELPQQRLHILQGLTKLRQICNSPALLNDERFYGTASAKLHRLVHEIEDKAPEHKILVFSQFVGMLKLVHAALTARGIATLTLTGQSKIRAATVEAFQQDPTARVFLISLKAGGTGLNLTEADYVYLVDPWWNPAVENQAIDRSHRLGQTKPVVAVRLICPDTVEEKIQELQAGKQELASDLIRTDTAVLKSLSAAELLTLFS
ncbi:DEAD/DEAH box helicase [Hymenobacter persicinus]|uniref:DEAD/DEAH box helicase n=1 Tax=Hymenobacter persicinus TaxID=2025506 RepID=A0A4Q5LGQ0_9BACT|nr:DEAD/DEAH box helicase [Hymenobacter persicinus]RYU83311.1 DEAD/DEAH box helicase [Hymenobacter persicinus]